jgi:ATPase subunit of ABC transporter with duplicated ATPase domains
MNTWQKNWRGYTYLIELSHGGEKSPPKTKKIMGGKSMSDRISEVYGEDYSRVFASVEAKHEAAERAEEQRQKDEKREQDHISAEKEKYRDMLKVPFMGISHYAYFIHKKRSDNRRQRPFRICVRFHYRFCKGNLCG